MVSHNLTISNTIGIHIEYRLRTSTWLQSLMQKSPLILVLGCRIHADLPLIPAILVNSLFTVLLGCTATLGHPLHFKGSN